jgi:hypothetical protein
MHLCFPVVRQTLFICQEHLSHSQLGLKVPTAYVRCHRNVCGTHRESRIRAGVASLYRCRQHRDADLDKGMLMRALHASLLDPGAIR